MKTACHMPVVQNDESDLLDELMEREDVDEMSLLDLIFIEEILNQKKADPTG